MRIVKFHDGFETEIQDYEEKAITDAMAKGARFVQIQDSTIAVASIARITDALSGPQEFKPEPREEYVGLERMAGGSAKSARTLLSGLLRYCDDNPTHTKARRMFEEKLADFHRRFPAEVATPVAAWKGLTA